MALFQEEENLFVEKFELMLKGNRIIFFDTIEFEEIIQHYLDSGEISKANRALSVGLEQHPSSNELKLLKAELCILEGNLENAECILSEIKLFEPNNPEVYIQEANIQSKKNLHQEAVRLLEHALNLTDEPTDVYYFLAMEYLYMDKCSEAKIYFKKCVEEDIQDYISLQQLIFCYDFLEEHDEAIMFLKSYLDKNPYCEVAWHHLGKQYLSLNNLPEALRCFDFAIISDDTFTGAYFEKAKILEQLKQYDEAIEQYKITLHLDDPTSYAYLRIGRCYEKSGYPIEAESFYLKSVYEDPQSDKSWVALSQFYVIKLEYERALNAIHKALLIDDMNMSYWRLSADIHLALNQKKECEKALNKAFLLGDYSLDNRIRRIQILIDFKEYDKALSLIEGNQGDNDVKMFKEELMKWKNKLLLLTSKQ